MVQDCHFPNKRDVTKGWNSSILIDPFVTPVVNSNQFYGCVKGNVEALSLYLYDISISFGGGLAWPIHSTNKCVTVFELNLLLKGCRACNRLWHPIPTKSYVPFRLPVPPSAQNFRLLLNCLLLKFCVRADINYLHSQSVFSV